MSDVATTYAALFDAVSKSEIVKTAAGTNWGAILSWALGIPAAGAAGFGLSALLNRSHAAPARHAPAHAPEQAMAPTPDATDQENPQYGYGYEPSVEDLYGYMPENYYGTEPMGVEPGTGATAYEGGWY
jgi:hypothetical protein